MRLECGATYDRSAVTWKAFYIEKTAEQFRSFLYSLNSKASAEWASKVDLWIKSVPIVLDDEADTCCGAMVNHAIKISKRGTFRRNELWKMPVETRSKSRRSQPLRPLWSDITSYFEIGSYASDEASRNYVS